MGVLRVEVAKDGLDALSDIILVHLLLGWEGDHEFVGEKRLREKLVALVSDSASEIVIVLLFFD